MPRSDQRQHFAPDVRIALLEGDVDTVHDAVRAVKDDLKDDFNGLRLAVETQTKESKEELASMRKILIGILVSVTTACILLAVNVIVIGAR